MSCGVSQQCEGDAETAILFWEALSGCCEEDARGSYSAQRGFGGYLGYVPVPKAHYTGAIAFSE